MTPDRRRPQAAAEKPDTKPWVLCVDDEPAVLEGMRDTLRRAFRVMTAESGAEGLELLSGHTFAVVLSDMRMPEMDGAQFLTRARQTAPDTTRMLLTGYADIDSAISAVNDGQVFRFLTKPCSPDRLISSLTAGVEQHRLVTAERVLLEQTLSGAVTALSTVLSVSSPVAFGRAERIKTTVTRVADRLKLPDRWQLEIAAVVSQLGFVVLPPELAEKLYRGDELNRAENEIAKQLPRVGASLVAEIPRLEGVREMVLGIDSDWTGDPLPHSSNGKLSTVAGAQLLRLAQEHDLLQSEGLTVKESLAELRGGFDPRLFEALESLYERPKTDEKTVVAFEDLQPGMVIAEDVRSPTGALLLARGHEVTDLLLGRIGGLPHSVRRVPVTILGGSAADVADAA